MSKSVFPLLKSVNAFHHTQGRIEGDPLRRHFRDRRVRDLIAKRTVLDRIRTERNRIDHVLAVAGVNRGRQFFRMRLVDHRAEQIEIHPLKGVARDTGFKDSLNRVHALRREVIDLLSRFLRRFRDAQKLRVETGTRDLRHFLRVFGAVSPFRGKERPAEEKFRPEHFAAVELLPQFQHVVDLVTRAPDRGNAAVKVGFQGTFAGLRSGRTSTNHRRIRPDHRGAHACRSIPAGRSCRQRRSPRR